MIVTAALQQYADRGVFRGLGVTTRPGGRYEYAFTWLMRRPFTLTYDPARRLFTFNDLFPDVGPRSRIAVELRRLVAERSTRRVPAHKRLDTRRVQAACAVRRERFGLTMRLVSRERLRPCECEDCESEREHRRKRAAGRGPQRGSRVGVEAVGPRRQCRNRRARLDEQYAVRHLLNLVNEMFLALHETYPDYLIAHFGLSAE